MVGPLMAGPHEPRNVRTDYYVSKIKDRHLDMDLRMAYVDTLQQMGFWTKENRRLLAGAYMMSGLYEKGRAVHESILEDKAMPIDEIMNSTYWVAYANMTTGNYDKALDGIYDLLASNKPDSLDYYDVEAYFMVATIYDRLGNLPKSATYLNRASKRLGTLKCDTLTRASLKYRLYMEFSSYYLKNEDYDRALEFNRRAEASGIDSDSKDLLLLDLAQIYAHLGDDAMVRACFKELIEKSRTNPVARVNLGVAWHNFALYLMNHGQYKESLDMVEQYFASKEISTNKHIRGSMYEIMAQDLDALGRHKEAYDALWQSRQVLDSIYGNNLDVSNSGNEAVRRFEERLALDDIERAKKKERKSELWVTALVIGISLAVLLLIWIIIRYITQRRGVRLMESENENREKEFQSEIEKSKGELTASSREIVTMSMQMAEKDAVISQIRSFADNKESRPEVILGDIRKYLRLVQPSQRTWEVFRLYFEKSHPGFFQRIHQLHPDLTQGETKMCAFINMGLTTKEIAAITCRSERGVDSMKYRLHKKLGLPVNTSTRTYLLTILTPPPTV